MSVNAASPYRREGRPSLQVPVVLPQITVSVDETGHLDVRLDTEPYGTDQTLERSDLQRIVNRVANDLSIPVRVEVHESDGSVFTDIVTPSDPPDEHQAPKPPQPASTFCASGFTPAEPVAIAVVVAHDTADEVGNVTVHLPPSLLAAHASKVVVVPTRALPSPTQGVA